MKQYFVITMKMFVVQQQVITLKISGTVWFFLLGHTMALFRNNKFMLEEIVSQNASKFAIF